MPSPRVLSHFIYLVVAQRRKVRLLACNEVSIDQRTSYKHLLPADSKNPMKRYYQQPPLEAFVSCAVLQQK